MPMTTSAGGSIVSMTDEQIREAIEQLDQACEKLWDSVRRMSHHSKRKARIDGLARQIQAEVAELEDILTERARTHVT